MALFIATGFRFIEAPVSTLPQGPHPVTLGRRGPPAASSSRRGRIERSQLALEQLPAWILREAVGENDAFRHLEMGKLLAAMPDDRGFVDGVSDFNDDNRGDGFDPARVRQADYRDLGDLRPMGRLSTSRLETFSPPGLIMS